jgi:DNA-binding response OmpR family regulator
MVDILIVEDHQLLRTKLAELFSKRGFAVALAENGRAGVELARKVLPALILSDLRMPVLDGLGLLRELRGEPETAAIPIILFSAETDLLLQAQVIRFGAQGYLSKELPFEELLAAVEAIRSKVPRCTAVGVSDAGHAEA